VGVERGGRKREIGGEKEEGGRIDRHCAIQLMEASSSQLYGAADLLSSPQQLQ